MSHAVPTPEPTTPGSTTRPASAARKGIEFPPDAYGRPGTWVAFADARSEWMAGVQSGHPLIYRVWFAAMWRCAKSGHARFESSELVQVLYADHVTGEIAKGAARWTPPSRQRYAGVCWMTARAAGAWC